MNLPTMDDDEASMFWFLEEFQSDYQMKLYIIILLLIRRYSHQRRVRGKPYRMIARIPGQVRHLNRMTRVSDTNCILNLRMDRNTFGRLCLVLRQLGGLTDRKYVCVEEQVAMFLSVLAHHKKNRIVGFNFQRSGQTISYYLHIVLKAIIKLHEIFLVKPTPVAQDCIDPRWKWFKGCLGALDGTYINVKVPNQDKPRYRTRKGQICTNTLAACDRDLKFIYVLTGWEGSAADGRVLRDAISREHGLRVPRGCYFLCDNGYANSEGFLTPYKGVRYHLKEWGPQCAIPQNRMELFNMRHTKARNVIERAFGVMKMRWGILRSASYYPVKVQNRIIMACFLVHNFIRSEMVVDPIEQMIDLLQETAATNEEIENEAYVDAVESTPAWNHWRDELAQGMWQA